MTSIIPTCRCTRCATLPTRPKAAAARTPAPIRRRAPMRSSACRPFWRVESKQRHLADERIASEPRCLLALGGLKHARLHGGVKLAEIDQAAAVAIMGRARLRD